MLRVPSAAAAGLPEGLEIIHRYRQPVRRVVARPCRFHPVQVKKAIEQRRRVAG